jgi:DNA adenine methylase
MPAAFPADLVDTTKGDDADKLELPSLARRLAPVEFLCRNALDVIPEYDHPDVLVYCDPPYLARTRTAHGTYRCEMTDLDHAKLLDVVLSSRSMIILSGYANPLYDERLQGWKRVTRDMANHSGQGRTKQRRVEVLWVNAPCVERRGESVQGMFQFPQECP